MGYIHYFDTEGNESIEDAREPLSLEEMQAYVGGYIELVHVLYKDKPTYMVVHDEGRILGLPINEKATDIYLEASRRNPERAKELEREWEAMGAKIIKLDPRPDLPRAIHGPAIVYEDIHID